MRRGARVYGLAKAVQLFQGGVPFTCQDVTGKLSPMGGYGELWVRREHPKVIEVISGPGVVAVRVLELAKVVQRVDLL